MNDKQKEATAKGYVNQAILFNANFTFSEVQSIIKNQAKHNVTLLQSTEDL